MKTYILQKDLPNVKAGAEFTNNGGVIDYGYHYVVENKRQSETYVVSYPSEIVENSDWFKEKDEKIIVQSFQKISQNTYQFITTNQISIEKYNAVKNAIEFVINNEHGAFEFLTISSGKKYTESDMRQCWFVARKALSLKFEEFINEKNQKQK